MKHLQLVLTVVLLTMVAVAPGFAGKARGSSGSMPTFSSTGHARIQKVVDPDIQNSGYTKASGDRSVASVKNEGTNRPVPKTDGTSSITSGLSGLYNIPGDFPNIAAAVAVLNFNGVAGPVTLQLNNASYTEISPVTIGAFPGASVANTVTIRPSAGTAVTVNFTPSVYEGKGFVFNGATGVTIDGVNAGGSSLTMKYSGGTFPDSDRFASTVYVVGGSSYIGVKNSTINGNIKGAWASQTNGRPAVFLNRDGVAATAKNQTKKREPVLEEEKITPQLYKRR